MTTRGVIREKGGEYHSSSGYGQKTLYQGKRGKKEEASNGGCWKTRKLKEKGMSPMEGEFEGG